MTIMGKLELGFRVSAQRRLWSFVRLLYNCLLTSPADQTSPSGPVFTASPLTTDPSSCPINMAPPLSSLNNNTIGSGDASRQQNDLEVKEISRNFLNHSLMATTDFFRTAEAHGGGGKLYQEVSRKVADFIRGTAGDDPTFIQQISVLSCDLAEISYGHVSPEHQYYIALYNACLTYADDLGNRHLEAIAQFSRRFATGEKQLHPALDVLTHLLKQSYDLWPRVGADAIVSGTLEAVTAMYVEYTTGDMAVTPRATWWPNYFRNRTSICTPYTHFNFMKSWRSTPDSYLQLLPYLEFFIGGANDVLSFYKEQLAGETKNYVHIRSTTDQATPVEMLRLLADEILACAQRIRLLIGEDRELMAIWHSFEQSKGLLSLSREHAAIQAGGLDVTLSRCLKIARRATPNSNSSPSLH